MRYLNVGSQKEYVCVVAKFTKPETNGVVGGIVDADTVSCRFYLKKPEDFSGECSIFSDRVCTTELFKRVIKAEDCSCVITTKIVD